MHKQNRNRLTDTESKLVGTSGEREGGGARQGYGIKKIQNTMYKIDKWETFKMVEE